MKSWVVILPALLFTCGTASSLEEPKNSHLPGTPAELVAWLPNTIWEIHSAIHHRAGEGYLMFRNDGFMTQIDEKGGLVETKIWAVNVKMLVVWGGGNLRVMTFNKSFTGFTDTRYSTTGRRNDDPAVRQLFQDAKPPKFSLPKDAT